MSVSPRNRYFTQPPDLHSQVFVRGWSDSATSTGVNGGLTTGLWVPQAVDASGFLIVSQNGSYGSYGFYNSGITGSQTQIPVNALSYSIYVESGAASINGVTYNATKTIQGGGYDGQKRLSSAINVGCTGSAASPCRVILNWEL